MVQQHWYLSGDYSNVPLERLYTFITYTLRFRYTQNKLLSTTLYQQNLGTSS